MHQWIQVEGTVKQGYGVASGRGGDPRFPHGTITMQKPFFQERGLNLESYFPGTINCSIAPQSYEIKRARYTFRNIKWSPLDPAEDFSFFDCRIQSGSGETITGLIYYPHPETKPEHFQSPDVLELITPYIAGLQYGDRLLLEVDPEQITLHP